MPSDASTQVGYAPAIVDTVLDWLLSALRHHATATVNETAQRRPMLIGLSGLQGSGKSTFARQLADVGQTRGVAIHVLSLDDFYLGRRDRMRLARDVHPLLATRGAPGTHDLDLLRDTIDALGHASARAPVRIPRFDKGRDTRVAPSRWHRIECAPQLIVLEGWCIGIPEQRATALASSINALECEHDSGGQWRHWVNVQLSQHYARLWQRLDSLMVLDAPNFDVVSRWRGEQEDSLCRRGALHAMDRAGLHEFLMHYERLSRHALRELRARADLRVVLREDRSVTRIVTRR